MVAPIASIGEDNNGHFVFGLTKEADNYLVEKKQVQIGELTRSRF